MTYKVLPWTSASPDFPPARQPLLWPRWLPRGPQNGRAFPPGVRTMAPHRPRCPECALSSLRGRFLLVLHAAAPTVPQLTAREHTLLSCLLRRVSFRAPWPQRDVLYWFILFLSFSSARAAAPQGRPGTNTVPTGICGRNEQAPREHSQPGEHRHPRVGGGLPRRPEDVGQEGGVSNQVMLLAAGNHKAVRR